MHDVEEGAFKKKKEIKTNIVTIDHRSSGRTAALFKHAFQIKEHSTDFTPSIYIMEKNSGL